MTYSETLEYLYRQLPMFHRIGPAAYKASLDNITALSEALSHPENKFKSIHIAGTNGKGSVSCMLASVLMKSGYRTGLFTSPHLKDFRERIRINGKMIDQDYVTGFVEEYKMEFEKIESSFFEWTTALAFHYFADEKVDVAVIETGLGGRLDSTNIITPLLSVITNISNDHKNLLGNSLQEIAGEKAGIIKKNIPVIIGERQPSTDDVFNSRAANQNAQIIFAPDNFTSEIILSGLKTQNFKIQKSGLMVYDNLKIDLPGNYQQKNIVTVLQSLEILKNNFSKINSDSILDGLSEIKKNTGLSGRWEVLNSSPLVIADVAHNEEGVRTVVHQLSELSFEKLHIVFGVVNDKDITAVLSLLPDYAIYYFCRADIPRSMDAKELKQLAAAYNLFGDAYASVTDAKNTAMISAGKNDIVFIGGSTFVVGEAIV